MTNDELNLRVDKLYGILNQTTDDLIKKIMINIFCLTVADCVEDVMQILTDTTNTEDWGKEFGIRLAELKNKYVKILKTQIDQQKIKNENPINYLIVNNELAEG
jgi:hypothetical protein